MTQIHPSQRYSCLNVKIYNWYPHLYSNKNYNLFKDLRNGSFPDDLKAAEVGPIFFKNDDLEKENYRPFSVLPHMSKVNVSMKIIYRNYLQDSEKIIAPNTV